MGYRVHLSLGSYPIKEYVYFLKEFYDEFQKYEIEIVDGLNFTHLSILIFEIIVGN